MLGVIVDEMRYLLEVDVRPPAPGARPGMPSSSMRTTGGSVARRMQRPPTPRATLDAQKRNKQLQLAAKQTAMRQQKAARQTRATLPQQSSPQTPSTGQ